jgi:hypothetical protein
MRWIFACVACFSVLLFVLFLPNLGVYVALVLIAVSLLPAGFVESNLGGAMSAFARAHGLDQGHLLLGIIVAPLVCFGVGCLIKAIWQRDAKPAAVGIACLGYLALTVVAYFRFNSAFHG